MPLLDTTRLPDSGPAVQFADLPSRLVIPEPKWPEREQYANGIFFSFSDGLCEVVCSASRTYLPFDPTKLTQLRYHYDLMHLAAEFLLRARILCLTPVGYLRQDTAMLFQYSKLAPESYTERNLQQDLVDTLLFLSTRITNIAVQQRCLVLVGY